MTGNLLPADAILRRKSGDLLIPTDERAVEAPSFCLPLRRGSSRPPSTLPLDILRRRLALLETSLEVNSLDPQKSESGRPESLAAQLTFVEHCDSMANARYRFSPPCHHLLRWIVLILCRKTKTKKKPTRKLFQSFTGA